MHGSAMATSVNERSSRLPISHVVISATANGFGARLSASAMPAPASALTATPARISPSGDSFVPASSSSGTNAATAPRIANAGSSKGVAAAKPKYSAITAPSAAAGLAPRTDGSASGLRR